MHCTIFVVKVPSVPVQVKDFKPVGDQVLGKFHDWVSSGADGASNWHLEKENHEGWRVITGMPAAQHALCFFSHRARSSLSVMLDLDVMPEHQRSCHLFCDKQQYLF